MAGPHVRNACRRHLRDLAEGQARGIRWDLAAATRALRFFPDVLRLAGGQFEGKAFNLEPAQQFIVGSLYGWKLADGSRRFRRAYVEMGKGNGKSPLAAGLGIYGVCADGEPRAEVYAAASKRDQAMVLFRDAVAMREQSPALRKRLHPTGGHNVWNLAHIKSGSFFRPIASDDSQSGPRPSMALCDELHEHRDGTVVEMLERGFKSRRQPLLLMITNSGTDPNSVCWQEHSHAVRVAAGEVEDDSAFSYVCALDEGDDPLNDPSVWIKANPTLGAILKPSYLAGVANQARTMPGKRNNILRLHFCVWTDAESAWLTKEAVEGCFAEFDPWEEHAGAEIVASADLAAVQDMLVTAFAVRTGEVEIERVQPDGEVLTLKAPTYDAWVEAWTPGGTLRERAERDRTPYDVWARDGYLHAPPGPIIRFDDPAARLAEYASHFVIKWMVYDRYAFRKFEEALDTYGAEFMVIEHPQGGRKRGKLPDEILAEAKRHRREPPEGLWFPGSLADFEQLILEKRIRIRKNPVVLSAILSAAIEGDPLGNRWLSKRKAVFRIDAAVALVMVAGALGLDITPAKPRSYQVLFV